MSDKDENKLGPLGCLIVVLGILPFYIAYLILNGTYRYLAVCNIEYPECIIICDQNDVPIGRKPLDSEIDANFDLRLTTLLYNSSKIKVHDNYYQSYLVGADEPPTKVGFGTVISCPPIGGSPPPAYLTSYGNKLGNVWYGVFPDWIEVNNWLSKYGFDTVDYENLHTINDNCELNDDLCRWNESRRQGVKLIVWNYKGMGIGKMTATTYAHPIVEDSNANIFPKYDPRNPMMKWFVECATGKTTNVSWDVFSITAAVIFTIVVFLINPLRFIAIIPILIYFQDQCTLFVVFSGLVVWLLLLFGDSYCNGHYTPKFIPISWVIGTISALFFGVIVYNVSGNTFGEYAASNYMGGFVVGWGLAYQVTFWLIDPNSIFMDYAAYKTGQYIVRSGH